MNKVGIIVAIFIVAFLALIAYSTLSGPRYRVEVCMASQGRSACRTVSAKSEQAAVRDASDNACADIASGVTDTMKCTSAEPHSVRWLERPTQSRP
jgi:hypothetical protein